MVTVGEPLPSLLSAGDDKILSDRAWLQTTARCGFFLQRSQESESVSESVTFVVCERLLSLYGKYFGSFRLSIIIVWF